MQRWLDDVACPDCPKLKAENEHLRRRVERQDKLILGCGVIIGSAAETMAKVEELLNMFGRHDVDLADQLRSAVNSLVEARKELGEEGENGE